MRVSGFENIPGAPGNLLAGINMSGFDINKRPGALGGFNFNTLLAQASPGGQNIGNVGGMMGPLQDVTPMSGFEGYGSPQPTGPSPDQLKALQTYDNAKQKKTLRMQLFLDKV